MIEIKNTTKVFGKNFKAVDNLNLDIKAGEIFGFLGPNGAGKTTTIKMITGITEISAGEILVDGFSIAKDPIRAKEKLGFVPDDPNVLLRLSGIEYLNFIASVYGVNPLLAKERINKYANLFSLEADLQDKIQSFSHGMRQKLLVIGVLLHQPSNLILDEPMTGLDPQSAFNLKKVMREYANEGNTVLFSTHVLEVAEKLCDRIGVINKGKLLFVGTIEELRDQTKSEQSLEDLFLELTSNA
ncbi:MAG TPA: ABC transporter ATP-binding protein [Bacilli bacterium]|nr:ABC transporter ATP-binding protein [Bacilli bacterium]